MYVISLDDSVSGCMSMSLYMAHLRYVDVDSRPDLIPASRESNSAAEAGPWRRF